MDVNTLYNPHLESNDLRLVATIQDSLPRRLFTSDGSSGLTPGTLYWNDNTGTALPLGTGINTNDPRLSIMNMLRVKKNPGAGEYSTVTSALAAVTSPSATNRWIIYIGPGRYIEPAITIPQYTYVVGAAHDAAVIVPASAAATPLISMSQNSALSFLTIDAVTNTGFVAVSCVNVGNFVIIHKVTINTADIGIDIRSTAAGSNFVYLEYVDLDNCTSKCVNVSGTTGTNRVSAEDFFIISETVSPTYGVFVSGVHTVYTQGADISGLGINTGVYVAEGATLELKATKITGWVTAVNNPVPITILTGCILNISNCLFLSNTTNLNILDTATTGFGDGYSEYNKTIITDTSSFFITNKAKQIITVATKGGDYTTLHAAIASIGVITPAASSSYPYSIRIAPGNYTVTSTIVVPANVEIIGESYLQVNIIGSGVATLMQPTANVNISNITLTNVGGTLIEYNGSATAGILRLRDIRFGQSILFIRLRNTSGANTTLMFNSVIGTSFAPVNCFDVVDAFFVAYNMIIQMVGGALGTVFNVSGTAGQVLIGNSVMQMLGSTSGVMMQLQNGAIGRINNVAAERFVTVFSIPADITTPTFRISQLTCINSTNNINIQNVNASGSLFMLGEKNKVVINSPNVAVFIQDQTVGATSTTMQGKIFYGKTYGTITDVSSILVDTSELGVISGGVMSSAGALTINVTAGTGYLVMTQLTFVEWLAQGPIALTANSINYIYVTSAGTVTASVSLPPTDTTIFLGYVITATAIVSIVKVPETAVHLASNNREFLRSGLGVIYKSGSLVTFAGPVLLVSSGVYYYSAVGAISTAGASPVTFDAIYSQLVTTDIRLDLTTNSVPTKYNDIITNPYLFSIPAGRFTAHALYVTSDNVTTKYILRYGQAHFSTQAEAEGYLIDSGLGTGVPIIASIIMSDSTVVKVIDRRPFISTVAASVTPSVTAHSSLTGLTTGNDHTQYLLRDGTQPMTGSLDLGTNNITNVVNINGYSINAHASRHQPGGADAIPTAAPVTIGTANAIGISTSLARADHVHSHGAQTDGTLHAAATTSVSGFMSSGDKTIFDARTASNTASTIMTRSSIQETALTALNIVNGANTTRLATGATSNWTMTLPVNGGTSGQVLQTNGSGTTSWVTGGGGGGFADPMTTAYDTIYRDDTNTTTRLPLGPNGTVLRSQNTTFSAVSAPPAPSLGYRCPYDPRLEYFFHEDFTGGTTGINTAENAGWIAVTGGTSSTTNLDIPATFAALTSIGWMRMSVTTVTTAFTGLRRYLNAFAFDKMEFDIECGFVINTSNDGVDAVTLRIGTWSVAPTAAVGTLNGIWLEYSGTPAAAFTLNAKIGAGGLNQTTFPSNPASLLVGAGAQNQFCYMKITTDPYNSQATCRLIIFDATAGTVTYNNTTTLSHGVFAASSSSGPTIHLHKALGANARIVDVDFYTVTGRFVKYGRPFFF